MTRRLPSVSSKKIICIICEGNEEYYYIERLRSLNVWNNQYEFYLINAEGNGNIPARYQDAFQNCMYELVLVFCDTDNNPYKQYEDIKRKINDVHGNENAAKHIVIFGNPCTLQIISKHWTDEIIKSAGKATNAPLIEKYTNVKNYRARADQLEEVLNTINERNYRDMSQRVKQLEQDDTIKGSSNFSQFMNYFESENSKWIEKINNIIDSDE